MNGDRPFGLSMVLSGIGLIAFAAFVFLGLDYHYEGNLLLPVVMTMTGVVAVVWCLVEMCKSKKTRHRSTGRRTEVLSALVVIAVLIMGVFPFSLFMHIFCMRQTLQDNMMRTVEIVDTIGPQYREYARDRISAYRAYALSRYSAREADRRAESLERRLLPSEMEDIDSVRHEWLQGLDGINVWNIYTPKNISAINDAACKWVNEYAAVSKVIYEGEEAEPFSMPRLDNTLSAYSADFVEYSGPDAVAVLAALGCFVLILVPYVITRRSKSARN